MEGRAWRKDTGQLHCYLKNWFLSPITVRIKWNPLIPWSLWMGVRDWCNLASCRTMGFGLDVIIQHGSELNLSIEGASPPDQCKEVLSVIEKVLLGRIKWPSGCQIPNICDWRPLIWIRREKGPGSLSCLCRGCKQGWGGVPPRRGDQHKFLQVMNGHWRVNPHLLWCHTGESMFYTIHNQMECSAGCFFFLHVGGEIRAWAGVEQARAECHQLCMRRPVTNWSSAPGNCKAVPPLEYWLGPHLTVYFSMARWFHEPFVKAHNRTLLTASSRICQSGQMRRAPGW